MPSPHELAQTYRAFYRTALRAVLYSKPARYQVRDWLREAFRHREPTAFDAQKTSRTLQFLDHAASSRGLEHQVVKNLLYVRGVRYRRSARTLRTQVYEHAQHAYDDYDETVRGLDESMGLCLMGESQSQVAKFL